MVKAVFFDFYNTLVQFWPPLDEIQQASCKELGINVGKPEVRRGYAEADQFMASENAKTPLAERTAEERDKFFAEYERIILDGAGVKVSLHLAAQVWYMAIQVPKDFALFDDVAPALQLLRNRGIVLGVISNLRQDMGALCKRLGLDSYLDFAVTSAEAGAEKPHAPVFEAALKRAGVRAEEALHVGDQYGADVLGARAVGMAAVLLDREGWHQDINDCPKISGLPQLEGLLNSGL